MKVIKVTLLLFSRKLSGNAWNPAFRWRERKAPLIVIEFDNGVRGIGESWSGYNETEQVLDILRDYVAPALIGCEFHNYNEISEKLAFLKSNKFGRNFSAAWSGADIALWDAFGHLNEKPLWELLSGKSAYAPVYASGGLYQDNYSIDKLYDEASSYKSRGFTSMKMKVAGVSIEEDLLRIAAVREAMGEDAIIWIDAVNQLTPETGLNFWERVQPYLVSGFQSPIPASNINGHCYLRDHNVPVIASEGEFRHSVFEKMLEKNAVHILQYCLPLAGGISGGIRLASYAKAFGIKSSPQCFSTSVAQAATLHFSAARPDVITAEYHCFHDHLKDLYLGQTASVHHGVSIAGTSPGLGVKIPDTGLQRDGSAVFKYAEII